MLKIGRAELRRVEEMTASMLVLQVTDPNLDVDAAEDLAALLASPQRLVRQCIERRALLVPARFPAPFAGWVREQGHKTVFMPGDGQI
jgi:hypothetical protein